jgi:hypothetical protein
MLNEEDDDDEPMRDQEPGAQPTPGGWCWAVLCAVLLVCGWLGAGRATVVEVVVVTIDAYYEEMKKMIIK